MGGFGDFKQAEEHFNIQGARTGRVSCETDCKSNTPKRGKTVGQALDEQIAAAREQVERLCVKKAKAEALNILNHSAEFYAF